MSASGGVPFVMTPEWILTSGISAQAQALYTALLGHVNHKTGTDESWPGMDSLAELLGFKQRKSVRRYVQELVAIGAVEVRRRPNSLDRRNIYTLRRTPPESASVTSLAEFHMERQQARHVPRAAPSPTPRLGLSREPATCAPATTCEPVTRQLIHRQQVEPPRALSRAASPPRAPSRQRWGAFTKEDIPVRDPACWAWKPADCSDTCSDHGRRARLRAWHRKRCGVCRGSEQIVWDHDHRTGLVRGLLCHRCNLLEGLARGVDDVFARWRACPPTAILGLRIVYLSNYSGIPALRPNKDTGPVFLPESAPISLPWSPDPISAADLVIPQSWSPADEDDERMVTS